MVSKNLCLQGHFLALTVDPALRPSFSAAGHNGRLSPGAHSSELHMCVTTQDTPRGYKAFA